MNLRGRDLPPRRPYAEREHPVRFGGSRADFRGSMTDHRPLARQPLFVGHSSTARGPSISLSLLFTTLILVMISITLPQDGSVEKDYLQWGLRGGGYFLAGLSVLFALGGGKIHVNRSILLWACIPALIIATSLFAPEPLLSLGAGITHFVLLLLAWRIVNRSDQKAVFLPIILAGMIISALSIVAFYLFPDLGRSVLDSVNADPGGRMRGVTAQPNVLGSISALTILLAIMQFKAFNFWERALAVLAIGIATFCLAYSESRTSIAALLLCLFLWRICRSNVAFNLFAVTGLALVATLVIAFIPNISAHLARNSAAPDEIASLNGRSRIWAVAWENIREHPIIGQGYGASSSILPIDDRLFTAAVNTHNLYLELLFSGGIVLLAVFLIGVAVAILRSLEERRVEALIVLLFFLIRGGGEAAPYGGLPMFAAFTFYVAVSLCIMRAKQRQPLAQLAPLSALGRDHQPIARRGRPLRVNAQGTRLQ